MSKFIDKPIEVKSSEENCLFHFRYNGRWIRISQTLELWKDTGTWWNGEPEKIFHRVESSDGSLYELYQDSSNGSWFLYRVYD